MKKYRIIAIVLALCLMSVFSISVLAAENNDSDLGSAYAVVTDPGAIITPRSATGSFSGTLTGEYVNYDMVLQGDYHHCTGSFRRCEPQVTHQAQSVSIITKL